MSATAAVQLPWQSSSVEMMPPLTMPGKAQYLEGTWTKQGAGSNGLAEAGGGGVGGNGQRTRMQRGDWEQLPAAR